MLIVRLLVMLSLLLAGGVLSGQAQRSTGVVSGRIVDSQTMLPLEHAGVQLESVEVRIPESGGSPLRNAVLTDSLGEYRFTGVVPGVYRLVVRRAGYLPRSVEVDLRQATSTLLSFGLQVEAVLLPPIRVLGEPTQPYSHTDGTGLDLPSAQAAVARLRRARYVTGDVRELTHADVVEAITLAESDIFRALQRTPGVSTRDDYTATLWTRGAPWDQTRVYFDGLPLYNPTHAGWLFSAINPDAVGGVAFYPGMRSARWGEGAAGVLEVRSRSGGENGSGLRGRGELSLASARMSLDGQALGGALGWMVAARRTYVDLVTAMTSALSGSQDGYFPYDFADLVARVDGRLGDGWSYVASGIVERDNLRGDVPGLLRNNRGFWGNRTGQVTVGLPLGPLRAEVQTGQTRFRAAIEKHRRVDTVLRRDPTLPPVETGIDHRRLAVEIRPRNRSTAASSWAAGFQSVRDSIEFQGAFPLVSHIQVVLPGDTSSGPQFQSTSGLGYNLVWGERRQQLGRQLVLEGGIRMEFGDSVLNGGELRAAPRLAGRWELPGGLTASAAWSRSFQYIQDIAPVAGPLGPQLHLTHFWVHATPRPARGGFPAIRADVSTVGLEHWLRDGWQTSLTGYHRRATGVLVPYPEKGRVTLDRIPAVEAENRAQGVELSARRLATRWTATVGYGYGVSRLRTEVVRGRDTVGVSFPSSADVRHSLDATGLVWLGKGLRLGGSFTYGSGVPYTQLILPGAEQSDLSVHLGPANGRWTPSYSSLDLMLDYTTLVGTWSVTGYLQVRNLLNHDNRVTYSGSRWCPGADPQSAAEHSGSCGRPGDPTVDEFESGIPRLPLVGLRVAF